MDCLKLLLCLVLATSGNVHAKPLDQYKDAPTVRSAKPLDQYKDAPMVRSANAF